MLDLGLSRDYSETWRAMEKLVDSGKARAIGLSNFNILETRRILATCRVRSVVNQIELHPLLPQYEPVDFLKQEGIGPMAHQPLGGPDRVGAASDGRDALPEGPLPQQPVILDVAERCGVTPAQVCLSWVVQRGIAVVPKTGRESRMVENLRLLELAQQCCKAISVVHRVSGQVRFPSITDKIGFDIFDEDVDQPDITWTSSD